MGLFRKKKEAPAPLPEPQIDDDANWRIFSDRAFGKARDGNLPAAVQLWCEAVDRYDEGTGKYLQKLHDDIFALVSVQMLEEARAGRILPVQTVAEIDSEAFIKHGDRWPSPLCDELFYFAKENAGECTGPESASMLFIAGAYSIVGYLRFSSDIRESADKCREVSRLGNLTAEQCRSYKRSSYRGNLKPKQAQEFCLTIVSFFDRVAEYLDGAASKLTDEQLAAVRELRQQDRIDRLDHLANALQIVLGASVEGHLPKRKKATALDRELAAYVAEFLKTCRVRVRNRGLSRPQRTV